MLTNNNKEILHTVEGEDIMERSKYINPFTDYGFKKLFGEEASKHLLKSFLNDIWC